jgi:hypothetical protein
MEYNNCIGENTYVFKKKKKVIFHLSPVIGIRSADISQINLINQSQNVDFATKWNPVFGLNFEYVLPFNNNKWSIFFEPIYHYYKSEVRIQTYSGAAEYKAIELHLGLRHYFFLSESSALFLNATLMNYEIPINKSLGPLDIKSVYSFSFGGGYLFKQKASMAFRIATPREILPSYTFYSAKYNSFEIVFAYRIL